MLEYLYTIFEEDQKKNPFLFLPTIPNNSYNNVSLAASSINNTEKPDLAKNTNAFK